MNFRTVFACLTGFVCAQFPVQAQMNLTFDMNALGNPALNTNNVFVTFAANAADMTYGSGGSAESILFTSGATTINAVQYGTSRAYSLQEIATNGLTLNSATSLIGFVSYGSATGISELGVGVQPNPQDSMVPRYSNFEVSYNGTGGGADLTNISQFGGSLRMEFINAGGTQSFVQNTLNTGDTFRALAAASNSSSSALITNSGQYVRAVGPNVFPASVAGTTVQNPYPKFNAYLQSLNTTYGTNSVVNELTNLAPGAPAGGQGAVGSESTSVATNVNPSTTYNLDYHFDAIVTQVTTPNGPENPNGTYRVTLNGYVNATDASDPASTFQYDGLSIEIAADDLSENGTPFMTNFLYTESTVGQGIDVTFGGWDALNNDFGTGFVSAGLQLKAAGDFAQGMLTGFVGSNTTTPEGLLGSLTSYQWWQYPTLAYGPAQTENPFFSAWGDVISEYSDGLNGVPFSRGGVYGSPYDDRFALNLIAPDATTTEMRITLLADGNLTVIPEPKTYALLVAGLLALLIARRRLIAG